MLLLPSHVYLKAWITALSPGESAQCHQAVGFVPYLRQWKKGLFLDFQLLSLNNSVPFTEAGPLSFATPRNRGHRCCVAGRRLFQAGNTFQNSKTFRWISTTAETDMQGPGAHQSSCSLYMLMTVWPTNAHIFQASLRTPIRRASEINTD